MIKVGSLVVLLALCATVFGKFLIDSGGRYDDLNSNHFNDEECASLTEELIEEIKSHQPIVDKITRAIVNGEYSGDTWNA